MHFEDLLNDWTELFQSRIYSNEWLIKPSLHLLLGGTLYMHYIDGGKYKSTRVHPFCIQGSRTGKGEMMKLVHFLATAMNFKSFYTTKPTTASLTGTILTAQNNKQGEIHKFEKPGLLKTYSFIFYDEGGIIFKNLPFMEDLRDVMNMAMDEPGYVSKSLAMGPIEFPTNTSFCGGSIYKKEIAQSLLEEGFFQRTLFSFKQLSENERLNICLELENLKKIDRSDILPLEKKVINHIKKLQIDSQRYQTSGAKFKYLKFKEDEIEGRKDMLKDLYKSYFANQFKDDKQKILMDFFMATSVLLAKISSQHATVELKKEIDLDDYKYAVDAVDFHCLSIIKFLRGASKQSTDEVVKRQNHILDVIRLHQGITKMKLLELFREKTFRGEWDISLKETSNILETLLVSDRLTMKRGSKNNQHMHYVNV